MWPWEHLAVGYLCYSLAVHARRGREPRAWPVVALAVGTQFPDLVDKPLAWSLGVLPSGHSLAHSLLFALPVVTLAVAASRRVERPRVGAAFALGYLSHLPADAFFPVLLGGRPNLGFLLWPLARARPVEPAVGFAEMVRRLLARYVAALSRGHVSAYLAVEVGLMAAVLAVWLSDGAPPLGALRSWLDGRTPKLAPTSSQETNNNGSDRRRR